MNDFIGRDVVALGRKTKIPISVVNYTAFQYVTSISKN